eukprot:1140075-Pelagomonas_calceolata.AAC.3
MINWRSTTSESLHCPESPLLHIYCSQSSCPDSILVTPYHATLTPSSSSFSSSSSSSSHHVLRSRHGYSQRTSIANCVRQLHQLNANQQYVHLIEIKLCEDTRPGQQLEPPQWQHADLCKNFSGKAVTLPEGDS